MTATSRSPRVTVFVPAYNAESFIAEAIESILNQSYVDFELLLIDDGSEDTTAEIMTDYCADPRIRIVRNAENLGLPNTRNKGLRMARGEYIAFLDADDIAVPQRLQRQVDYLDAHPDISVLGSQRYNFDEKGIKKAGTNQPRKCRPETIHALSLFTSPVYNTTIMARAQALRDHQYDPAFRTAEDTDLWCRMLTAHHFAALPERLVFYRKHTAQTTQTRHGEIFECWEKIMTRELTALGLHVTAEDVRKHTLLHRGRKSFRCVMGYERDHAYLIWARQWLTNLIAANTQRRIYTEPAFSHVVSISWIRLCGKAIKTTGIQAVMLELVTCSLTWRSPIDYFRMSLGRSEK